MPTLSVGRTTKYGFRSRGISPGSSLLTPVSSQLRGVTLLELVVVLAIIGVVAGITYPSVANGLETVRLSSATDSVAAFINTAVNRAERRQEVIQMAISPKDSTIVLHSADAAFERKLELPDGITIQAVLPPLPEADQAGTREFLLMPGGSWPRVGVEVANRKGRQRIVRLDPMTGVPRIEVPEEKENP
jgi:prepilin-type N-terminal cleavage/methylation domain-containing protein